MHEQINKKYEFVGDVNMRAQAKFGDDFFICINSAPDPINMLDFLVFSVCPSTEFPRSQFFYFCLKIVLNFYIFFRELNFYMSMHLCIIYPFIYFLLSRAQAAEAPE